MGKKKKGSPDAPRSRSEGHQETATVNDDSKQIKKKNKKS